MADNGRHGAPLPAPPHATVAWNVGQLSYAAEPGVRHHGGRGMMAAAMASFSLLLPNNKLFLN